jgi:signal peptide peptidase SppA
MLGQLRGIDLASVQSPSGRRVVSENRQSVAVIPIVGLMQKYENFLTWLFNGVSTMDVASQVRAAAADPDISAIALWIDSGGGSAAGVSDLADAVFQARGSTRTVAYCSDQCCSAAYWVASQAQEIYCNKTAICGSVGTYAVVSDWSAAAEQAGVKVHVIRAGKFKGTAEPGSVVTDEQLNEIQRTVNAVNDQFLAGVARGRKMSLAKATELGDGKVHVGQAAKDIGLVDGIDSFANVVAKLAPRPRTSLSMAAPALPVVAAAAPAPIVAARAPEPEREAAPPPDHIAVFEERIGQLQKRGMNRLEAATWIRRHEPRLVAEYNRAMNQQQKLRRPRARA